ncbi:amine oxidase catalytic domain-containing protein [Periconia macrospinosa]|uniref:Amine oxidase n=1 Tax=Periconia macrospinosa TaxID=97972 RepID=A0A2V1DWV8_9PLEO|nr:amine oxidase catalytic domain-containing protein [Periconia macrospinosa]
MKRFFFFSFLFAVLSQLTIQECIQCSTDQPIAAAPHANVWRSLSQEEVSSVSKALSQRFNLTSTPDFIDGTDSYIFQIDLLQPNKTSVLPFLRHDAKEPERYARATVQWGSANELYLEEYIVGPLSISNVTSVQPLTFPFNNRKSGKTRLASIFAADTTKWFPQFSADIEDITRELWNTTIVDGGVRPRFVNPIFEEDGTQTVWATFYGPTPLGFDTISLLPLGVFLRVDMTSRRWEDWHITGWYYRGIFYETTADFRAAVFSPGFEKPPPNVDGPWGSTDRQGEPMHLDELPPPITVSQGKKRFSVDLQENYVTWMDFAFFMATSTDQGLSLFDIQYKGKRIIYELSLQEALAHYAGADPVQSETVYFDTADGMGRTMLSLVKDYDCPNHATYMNATWTDAKGSNTVPNAICLFEADANYPLRRHFAPTQQYTSVAKNVMFTVRWISTVGNYDYLFDYIFFYDGAIEVSVRASGYISSAYYTGNEDYGFKIHEYLSGSMHDHVMTFKADLDILGEQNSVQKVEFVPATVSYPWSKGQLQNTMKLEKSFIDNEADFGITWAPNDAAIYAIVNKNAPNKYGESPGYRIKRAGGASHLTIKDSSDAGNAIHYATADLFITKQKDTEPRCADRNNNYDISDPLVDFSRFLDGESLDQEDLVVWFNLGMHHVPTTIDLPNTLMSVAHSAVRIEPMNYLDGDASTATYQQVRVNSCKLFG